MSVESFIVGIIENTKSHPVMRAVLWLCSFCFCGVVSLRNFLYDKHFLKAHKVPSLVISVGNIVAGGTGKTPFLALLCKSLEGKAKLAIITRGYRSQLEKQKNPVLVSQGNGSIFPASICGDEPYFLARTTSASLWVGRNKWQSAKNASADGAKILLLDDGMQHRRLHRDIEIVLVDAKDPFGKGFFLPRGYLRDSPRRLLQADFLLANHVETEKEFVEIQKKLSKYSAAPVIALKPLCKVEEKTENSLVGAFCGIAKPDRFFSSLQKMGFEVKEKIVCDDHTIPNDEQLEAFARRLKNQSASAILCTEKDFVKLSRKKQFSLPIFPVKMELMISFGLENWKKLLEKIEKKLITSH